MAGSLPVKRTESIVDALERMRARIMTRAYEIFEGHGRDPGHDLDHWLTAERELLWSPPVEIEESDDELTVKLSAPGIDPKDVDVELTPDDLVVEAETHEETKKRKGKAQTRVQTSRKLFRAVHFPRKIDPSSAKAELKDGMLKLTARIAEKPEARRIKVASA